MRRVIPIIIAALIAAPGYAQDRTAQADKIFGWATPAAPGCAVAASEHGKLVIDKAYGSADLERGALLSPNSRFDIGSVRKQFIAASVLLLAEDGRLALTDDIRKHFPELPDYGHTVTIDHLLRHTSGMRDWTGILPLAGNGADVWALIVRQRALNFVPGDEWSYSNSGYVILKELVTRASGVPFAEFARKRLFEPIGMTSTIYVEDLQDVVKDRALPYEKQGDGWKQDMLTGSRRGGGGAMFSTARDLVLWNDALTSGRLGKYLGEKLEEPTTLNNGRTLTYARGLIVDTTDGIKAVVHTGGAGGYSSWLGRLPERGVSIAVLCNADAMGTSRLANNVADLFLPAELVAKGRENPPSPDVKGVDLGGKAGLFFNEKTGQPLRIVANGGRLMIAGGGPLIATGPERFRNARTTLFFMSQDSFEVRYRSPDLIEFTSMEGTTTRYRRARPHEPSAAELQELGGRYLSEELGAVLEILPENGALVMRLELSPDQALTFHPVERDVFQYSLMTMRFRRDAAGKVVGFDYSNPLVRDLPYSRVGDLAARTREAVALQKADAPTREAPAAATTPVDLAALTGFYEAQAGRGITVTLENGKLFGEPTGSTKRELAPQSGTTFAVGGSAAVTVTFELDSEGRPAAMIMRQGGGERRFPKVR